MTKQTLPTHTKTETAVGLAFDCLNGRRDGFSIDRDLNEPKGGFMVAGPQDLEYKVTDAAQARVIVELLYSQLLDGEYLGGWMYEGTLYLEISANVKDILEARYRASIYNQIAIWDVENGQEITLKK